MSVLADTGQGTAGGRGKGSGTQRERDSTRAAAPSAGGSDAAPADDSARFNRLTRRHRECLRGVRELKGSKEIAEELGIEKSTVDSYLTEAVRLLGARNRRDAALRWSEHEARVAQADAPETAEKTEETTPDKMGGDSARLSPPPSDLPPPSAPDETIVWAPGVSGEAAPRPSSPGIRLPFRRKGQRASDLSVGDRLIWIQAITLGIAIGFGMLMTGLQVLTGLIEALSQRLS